jgi:hypothetical protein
VISKDVEVVGRDAELATIDRFLDHEQAGTAVLVLEGEAGVGKPPCGSAESRWHTSTACGCFAAARPNPRRSFRSRRLSICLTQ